jgi:hypothetical protein
MILHPEGTINSNPNLTGIVEILCEQGFGVDIYSRQRESYNQEAQCSGSKIYVTDLIDPLDTAILFAPGIIISNKTISDVEKTFSHYDLVIGIDLGIIEACLVAKIIKVPYGLISYELTFAEEVGDELKEPEIIACRDISFAVCQDSDRSACLATENRIPLDKIINIPVAGRGIVAREKSYALHEALGISRDKKIALYMGSATSKWSGIEELLNSTQTWDDSWVLVLHERSGLIPNGFSEHFGVRKNVFYSPFPTLAFNEIHQLINAADVGIAFYTPIRGYRTQTGLNLVHLGMSSGKIATYLQHDLPIIINEVGEMSEHVRNHTLGWAVDDLSQLNKIMMSIDTNELYQYRNKGHDFFRSHLDLNMTIRPFLNTHALAETSGNSFVSQGHSSLRR